MLYYVVLIPQLEYAYLFDYSLTQRVLLRQHSIVYHLSLSYKSRFGSKEFASPAYPRWRVCPQR